MSTPAACLVNGKEMATADKPVPISPKGKFINVRIRTNKTRYLPGEKATYTITTTDENGRGVPAEVSLGVVDESIYAIREDSTPDIRQASSMGQSRTPSARRSATRRTTMGARISSRAKCANTSPIRPIGTRA